MRILDDGTVEIRNKRTGATKIVKPEELPNYGISYSKYQSEATAYKEAVKGGGSDEKATQEAILQMQSDIQGALQQGKPGIDARGLAWQWIHANEPYLGPQGIDISKLWAIHNNLPEPQPTPQTGGGFLDFLRKLRPGGQSSETPTSLQNILTGRA